MSSTRLALALLLPPTRPILSTRSLSSQPRSNPKPRRTSGSGVSSYGFNSSPIEDQRRDETPVYKARSTSGLPANEGEFGFAESQRTERSFNSASEGGDRGGRRPLNESRSSSSSSSSFGRRREESASFPPRSPSFRHPYNSNYAGPLHPTWKDARSSDGSAGGPPRKVEEREVLEFPGRDGRFQAEDLSVPISKRHPRYKKEVPVQRGGFDLGPRVQKEVVGKEREKEEGEDEGERGLTLHINSLPVETSAQAIYPRLIQAGLKVATCEAIVDGYRSTVVVELEKDESGVRAALKKLIEGTPILKNKIEITGNMDTVSDIFTPSKRRLAISNVPLYTDLPDLARFLHTSGVHNIDALQLVRHKGETTHSGLAFLWTREEQVKKLIGRELMFAGETRLLFGVAQDEPIPAQTNKSEFINGPAMKIRPSRVQRERLE
ncbi:hypothetical protein BDY24DRAFT_411659 [Mrakia frigida]|uniref:uncharacterized protein n=1 Tax=Mrakia frigida TaxID=29902 RepID=UPI003FCBF184